MAINSVDERLIIVPDDDDDDEDEGAGKIEAFGRFDIATVSADSKKLAENDQQSNNQTPSIYDFDDSECISSASSKPTDKLLRKIVSKPKPTRTKSSPMSITSSDLTDVPYVTFNNISNILTISRMGSTFYCVEDLYSKIYLSLCTLEQFVDFLTKPQNLVLKQVTLSEKMFITQHNPKLKSYTSTRFRLIPFDTSDYLLKLKHLLTEYPLNEILSQLDIYVLNKTNTKNILAQAKQSSRRSINESSTLCNSPSPSMPTIVNVEENVQFNPQSPPTKPPPNIAQSHLSASISLSQAILEHRSDNFDELPKLIIRHRKFYSTKMIEIMGQLFPTWFVSPTSRCIHCFTCDQVYTPRLFMLHTDDKQFLREKPLKITSIQLLASEQLSEAKVKLWNDFCTSFRSQEK